MNITFSIVQINCGVNQFESNFLKINNFLEKLPITESHLVVLPELWSSGFTDKLSLAHYKNIEIIESLLSIANSRNLLIAGSYIIHENDHYYNQLKVIGPGNKELTKYNKNHLFPQMQETQFFTKGDELSILEIWGIKIGMAICYDLRFPELFRNYAANKAEICILPAQWPEKRIDHFKTLLQARAIENQMFMISSNVCGKIENTIFGGHSSIIDHMGKIRAKIIDNESSTTLQIRIEDLQQWRKDFPVLIDADLHSEQAIKIYKVEE
jgi:predicted amidohydrolase